MVGRWHLQEGQGLNEASEALCCSPGGEAAAVRPFDPHCVAEEVTHRAHAYSIIDPVNRP